MSAAQQPDPGPATDERRPVPHVRDAVRSTPWAITDEAMSTIVAIVERTNDVSPQALEAYRGRRVQGAETMSIRDGVAVITVAGPLMRYADIFAAISGATSYEDLRLDLQMAVDRPDVRAILLAIDSPGGMVNGANEMADAIRAASTVKPVWAYIGGHGTSAAYWLAAGANRIIIEATAMVGSIGVRQGIRDTSERDARSGVKTIEFVSSQSPNKAVDPNQPAGQMALQKVVDDLAGVFVNSVAKHRGVSPDAVVSEFGGGGVKIGAEAVAAGMADGLGSFEGTVRALAAASLNPSQGKGSRSMNDKTHTQADIDAAGITAGTAARERIKAIMSCSEAEGRRAQAEYIAYDTDMSLEQARAMLGKSAKDTPAATETKPAPGGPADAQGRARDAAGGLALTQLQGDPPPADTKAKTKTIDASAIYGKLNAGR